MIPEEMATHMNVCDSAAHPLWSTAAPVHGRLRLLSPPDGGPMRGFLKLSLALMLSSVALTSPHAALASGKEASPTGKGVVGGALLGAEAMMLVEAAADVKP